MRILKTILLTLAIILGLVLLVGIFLPSNAHLERSFDSKAKAATLYKLAATPKSWIQWSPWHQIDPAMKLSYDGPESGQGAKYSWTSEHPSVGNGSMHFIEARENEYLKAEMNLGGGVSYSEFKFKPGAEGTQVTWTMDTDFGWNLIGRYFGLMLDGMVGPEYEKGLRQMDSVALAMEKANGSTPMAMTVEMAEMPYIGLNVTCPVNEISAKLGEAYGKILVTMGKMEIKEMAPPFAIWAEEPKETAQFTAAIFVTDNSKAPQEFVKSSMRAGKYVKVPFYGPYEQTGMAWKAGYDYIAANNLQPDGAGYEQYVTDPGTEPDPTKILTEIYIPVK